MAWVTDYQETLRELGIEEADLQFPGGTEHGSYLLTEKYITRVEMTLISWFNNILEVILPPVPHPTRPPWPLSFPVLILVHTTPPHPSARYLHDLPILINFISG